MISTSAPNQSAIRAPSTSGSGLPADWIQRSAGRCSLRRVAAVKSSESCTGDEAFAADTSHAVSIEVTTEPGSTTDFTLTSDDDAIVGVFDVVSSYDPCAQRTRLLATLETYTPGATHLREHRHRQAARTVLRFPDHVPRRAFLHQEQGHHQERGAQGE